MNNEVSLKAVLVAGGAGTRLSPFTNYTHKTLLPLFDRPVIDYALATIRKSGIKDITIIANEKIGQIANHIGMGREGEKIHYVIEHAPKGVASAINLARPYVEGSRILLYFSDNITTWDFHDDCERFRSSVSKPGAVLLARQVENPQDFGVCVMGDEGSIIDIVEKPKDPPSDSPSEEYTSSTKSSGPISIKSSRGSKQIFRSRTLQEGTLGKAGFQ